MTVTQAGPAPASGSQDPSHPVRRNFGRRKFDRQPTQQAPVLIATNGFPIPAATLRRARELSEGDPVAVVTIARIYGSSLGLPNPGLMPTRKEMADQKAIVEKAVGALERAGLETWGQVAASRRPVKTIGQAAKARGARHVIVVRPEQSGWRRTVEGDLAQDVARKLGPKVNVEAVNP